MLEKVHTNANKADMLTKSLPKDKHENCTSLAGLHPAQFWQTAFLALVRKGELVGIPSSCQLFTQMVTLSSKLRENKAEIVAPCFMGQLVEN